MFSIEIPLCSHDADSAPKLTTEESELMDFFLVLGQACWETFLGSPNGMVTTALLPSDEVRLEANRLFQLGFGARLILYPPRGPESLDRVIGPVACEKAWKGYLARSGGQTILDGKPYPETSEAILYVANYYFKMGFEAGTIAAREIMKEGERR